MTTLNAFTVDLEDWYQGLEIEKEHWCEFEARVEVGCGRLLDLLSRAGVRATFFALCDIGERHPDLVREIARRGHEIATHGDSHTFLYRQSPEQFRAELLRSVEILSRLSGKPVVGHRAPFFSITRQSLWALDVLADAGIRYDSSIFPVRNYRYGIPEAPTTPWRHESPSGRVLVEFPVSTVRLFGQNVPASGGAYFRIYLYAMTRWLLRRVNRAGRAAVFYVHPWELDPEQPRPPLPWRIRATHYHNLGRTAERVHRLLGDFRFGTLAEVIDDVEARGLVSWQGRTAERLS